MAVAPSVSIRSRNRFDPGVYDNSSRRSKRAKGDDSAPQAEVAEAKTDPKSDPQRTGSSPSDAPAEQARACRRSASPPAPAVTPTEPSTTTAAVAPADTAVPVAAARRLPLRSAGRRAGAQASARPTVRDPPSPAPAAQAQFAAWRLDTEEKEASPDRAMRRQPLRLSVDKSRTRNASSADQHEDGKDQWSGGCSDPNSGTPTTPPSP